MIYRTGGAQLIIPGIEVVQAGGESFAGAYDAIPSIAAAYGMRRLLTSYTGSLLKIRRSSDDALADIGYVANGDLDVAAIVAHLSGSNGFVHTWYDQKGSNNITQTTTANQPLYVASGQNSKPVARFDGSNDFLTGGDVLDLGVNSYSAIAAAKTAAAGAQAIYAKSLAATQVGRYAFYLDINMTSLYQNAAGNPAAAAAWSTASWSLWSVVLDRGTGANTIWRNASSFATASFTAEAANQNTTSRFLVGAYNDATDTGQIALLNGDVGELIICSAALSDANRGAAETAANAYWAIF